MKNLRPLQSNHIIDFDSIVQAKHITLRLRLAQLKQIVEERYQIYITHIHDLESIRSIMLSSQSRSDLLHCYTCRTIPLNILKKRILENQEPTIVFCQYCGIGEISSFDHYFPKIGFEEYCVLALNLVPCCSVCNGKKSNTIITSDGRQYINLYYDDLVTLRYLYVDIKYIDRIPRAIYYIHNHGNIPDTQYKLIEAHFRNLDLLNRYSIRTNYDISEIKESITSHLIPQWDSTSIHDFLANEAMARRRINGQNYWKSALLDALSTSPEFIDSCLS